jgi:flagellar motor switch protein FliN/FliY
MTETSFVGAQPTADVINEIEDAGSIADVAAPAVTSAAASFDAPVQAATPVARATNTGDRLELLGNVEMDITAELGRTRMTVRELLSLTPGTVVELDRAAGSPVDLFVNGTLIARGEVVVVDEEFGVRVSEIVSSDGSGSNDSARA